MFLEDLDRMLKFNSVNPGQSVDHNAREPRIETVTGREGEGKAESASGRVEDGVANLLATRPPTLQIPLVAG